MTNRLFRTAGAVLALLIVVLAAACGDDDKGLSRTDVEEIVRSELAAAQERQSAAAPPKYMPEEYTRFLVREAIDRYESDGRDATIAHYNSEESIEGQWYVFIMDPEGVMLAHAADPDLVNRPISDAVGPNEYPVGEALAAVADADGEWFSYTYPNPATGAVETKHSWVVLHDGLVFGTGWYEAGPRKSDAPAYTRALVQQALDLYDALGPGNTVAYYSSEVSVDGPWYVFIIGEDGRIIAHYDPERMGLDAGSLTDSAGRLYGPELVGATEEGDWVDYVKLNPETGREQQKHSWVVRLDGLVFGSGWYEELLGAARLFTSGESEPSPSTADTLSSSISEIDMDGEGLAALNQAAMLQVQSYRFAGDYILEPLIGVPGQARIEGWHSRSPEQLWVRIDSTSPGGRSVEVLLKGEKIYVRAPAEESWYESPAEEIGFDDGSALLQATFMMSTPRVPETSEVQELGDLYSVSYSTPQGSVVISYNREHLTREVLVSGTMSLAFSEYDSGVEFPDPDVAGPVPDGYFDDFWD